MFKYRAMEVQLFAMKIMKGSKIVLYRVLQKTDYQHCMSCCRHAVLYVMIL